MRYTITFAEDQYNALLAHLFVDRTVERAAYALCGISVTDNETRLLVRDIIPVVQDDIETASEIHMTIASRSFLRVMKKADETKQFFLFIHSHPENYELHSPQDDVEEEKLFRTAYTRIKTSGVHGSIVISAPNKPVGRIWLDNNTFVAVDMIRVIGNKFSFYSDFTQIDPLHTLFDRQIRAFGDDLQKLLQVLHIGVVGVGGTGSAVTEQLVRLGVGTITVIDGQAFEKTNVNRVYGSSVDDERKEKVLIAESNATKINVGTHIFTVNKSIAYRSSFEHLKNCDIVFGCTDDDIGRSRLTRLAIFYQIPIFDMGVKIDSEGGNIKSIQGRVTTLLNGCACLFCRDRISGRRIYEQSLALSDPERLKELQRQGYADELETPAPSVIPFTTTIASLAVTEFIHRLTGFMGNDRETNEIIMFFDQTILRRNKLPSRQECFCSHEDNIMRGDIVPLLGSTWPHEN